MTVSLHLMRARSAKHLFDNEINSNGEQKSKKHIEKKLEVQSFVINSLHTFT